MWLNVVNTDYTKQCLNVYRFEINNAIATVM